MLAVSLLMLSLCIGITSLIIHQGDEIHQMLAFLSAMLALICIFILTPPIMKSLIGLLFFYIGHKVFPVHSIFK